MNFESYLESYASELLMWMKMLVVCCFRDEGNSAVGTDHLGRAWNWKVWGESSTESLEHQCDYVATFKHRPKTLLFTAAYSITDN